METLAIVETEENDVEKVKDLFTLSYGADYPFKQFYNTHWLKKAVFDDEILFLVARADDKVAATGSVAFTSGDVNDLIGEFGRLVVHPEARGRRVGALLFSELVKRASPMIQFGFAETRTMHDAAQKIAEKTGFSAVGFEPHKYILKERESVVMYARLFGDGRNLRRNNPRIIPEIAPLAQYALQNMGLPQDAIVVDDETGFPTTYQFKTEELEETGWSLVLHIERGRVKEREVFGNLSLSYGFFKIKANKSCYIIAREDKAVLGGVGFTHDPVDSKVKIFELIGFDDKVKGWLLKEADRIARNRFKAVYIEVDVSAYSPAIQRTLERLGFYPVCYCPSMVFQDVERLDVVRMAKLYTPYFREDIPLTQDASSVRRIVERSMEDRRLGSLVAEAAVQTSLFSNMDDGDIYHLARIGRIRRFRRGEYLMRKGEKGDRIFIIISGSASVLTEGREIGNAGTGETVGEMTLVDKELRSADVVATEEVEAAEFLSDELIRLMERKPRLGMVVMQNIASSISLKLRRNIS